MSKPKNSGNKLVKLVKSKLAFLHKKTVLIGIIGGLVILLPIIAVVVMYYAPIKSFSYNKDNNTFAYSKVPVFSSSVKVYRNDQLIEEKKLSGFKGNVNIDFSQDGFYKIEYKVASKTTIEEFEIDRTPPEINIEYSDITNLEKSPIKVSLNEEGKVWVKYTKVVTDENTGEKTEQEQNLDVIDGQVELELREGTNNFTVYAKDEWNNEGKKDVSILADYTNPKIELIFPNYKETYNTTAEIKCQISDENDVAKVTINGTEVTKNAEGFFVLSMSLKDGDNGVEIIAWDKAGNEQKETSNVLKKISAVNRTNKITNPNNNNNNNGTQPTGCSNTKTGYNVFCYINELRKSEGKSAMSWNSTNANYAYWYAYCLQTTGFQGDPHYGSDAVYACYEEKAGGYATSGSDIHSYGYSTASGVANGWWNSPVHKSIVSGGSNIGIGCYGSWCTANVN